jgi:predicted amidohydrolase YtcJ
MNYCKNGCQQGFMADLIIVDRDIFELPPEPRFSKKAH